MSPDTHTRARRLLVLGEAEAATADQVWLQEHLTACSDCRQYGAALLNVAAGLRAQEAPARFALVEDTTRRVRHVAVDWRLRRERTQRMRRALVVAALVLAVAIRLVWAAFTSAGARMGYSRTALVASFFYFWLIPTLAAGVAIVIGSARLDWSYRSPLEGKK